MNRTIKEAAIKSYESVDMAQLRGHVLDFVKAIEGITLESTLQSHMRS